MDFPMRTALTGTPGTGKTTISNILNERYGIRIEHLHDVIVENGYYLARDEFRDSLIVDIASLAKHKFAEECLIEGHFSHYLQVDLVIVLRTNPKVLKQRLYTKGYSEAKVLENYEAEILDVILIEALEIQEFDKVYEVDTTSTLENAISWTVDIMCDRNRDSFRPGKIDWTGYI
jgi:adenylate kinase